MRRKKYKNIAALTLCAVMLVNMGSIGYAAEGGDVDGDAIKGGYIDLTQTQDASESASGDAYSNEESSSGSSQNRSSRHSYKQEDTRTQEEKAADEARSNIVKTFSGIAKKNIDNGGVLYGNNSINSFDLVSVSVDNLDADNLNDIGTWLNEIDGLIKGGYINEQREANLVAVETVPVDFISLGELTPVQFEKAKKLIAEKENCSLSSSGSQVIKYHNGERSIAINAITDASSGVLSALQQVLERVGTRVTENIGDKYNSIADAMGRFAGQMSSELEGRLLSYRAGDEITLGDLWGIPSGDSPNLGTIAPIQFTYQYPGRLGTSSTVWGIRSDLVKGGLIDAKSYVDRLARFKGFGTSSYMSDDVTVATILDYRITKAENMSTSTRKEDPNIRYWQAYDRDTGQPHGSTVETHDPKTAYRWYPSDEGVYVLKEYIPVTYTSDCRVYYQKTAYLVDADTKCILWYNNIRANDYVSLGKEERRTVETTGLEYVIRVNEFGEVEDMSGTQRVK